ncbi:unnamed protein product, partial [Phaeothamnion confervicola]
MLVSRHDGMVRQFVVDDKGCILIVCFGVPGFSHDNDPELGVLLGLSVRNGGAPGVRASVGITTGRVFCGIVGAEKRREYAMVGDAINVAARLACLHADDFIVDEETYKLTRLSIEYDGIRQVVMLKGQNKPALVYRP